MGIIDKLKNIFSLNGSKSNLIEIYLKDQKCGNKIKVLLRKSYDIPRVYEANREAAYEIKKVIICDQCYNKIKLDIEFDKRYNILKQEIEQGEIITKKEFENN